MKESEKRYRLYEYIKANDEITENLSNTKKLILKLMKNDKQTEDYCNRKMLEEKGEVEDAIIGKHYHETWLKEQF